MNTSCKWWLDDAIREEYAQSDRRSTDPQEMAETQVDRKYRLPGSDSGRKAPAARQAFRLQSSRRRLSFLGNQQRRSPADFFLLLRPFSAWP